jgi:hypothetical protein
MFWNFYKILGVFRFEGHRGVCGENVVFSDKSYPFVIKNKIAPDSAYAKNFELCIFRMGPMRFLNVKQNLASAGLNCAWRMTHVFSLDKPDAP